jgi:hypothetical protein
MCDGMMMVYSITLIGLAYIEDGIKVCISVGRVDALVLLDGSCLKVRLCRMATALTC